jgi:hypothetical protein
MFIVSSATADVRSVPAFNDWMTYSDPSQCLSASGESAQGSRLVPRQASS